jgi:DNA-binding CsgD family transcriptional regulator
MSRSPSDGAGRSASLTQRDVALLRCLGSGGSTAQIAAALSVSSNTARTRIRRVQGRLGVGTRADLAAAAAHLGGL